MAKAAASRAITMLSLSKADGWISRTRLWLTHAPMVTHEVASADRQEGQDSDMPATNLRSPVSMDPLNELR